MKPVTGWKALSLEQIVEASTPGKVARLVHKESIEARRNQLYLACAVLRFCLLHLCTMQRSYPFALLHASSILR